MTSVPIVTKATINDWYDMYKCNHIMLPEKYPEFFFIVELQKQKDAFHYVARNTNGDFQGYIMCKIEQDKDKTAHVWSLAVYEKYQRQGIGSILMDTVVEVLKKEEMKHLILHVRESNQKAISFYRKKQFGIKGRIDSYYEDEHGILMEIEFLKWQFIKKTH